MASKQPDSSPGLEILGKHMEHYNVETSAIHRKLQSKVEALRILREELERSRTERDQFKLMAETLQLRYSSMKRTDYGYVGSKSVVKMLHEQREQNIRLTTEVECLKQKNAQLSFDLKTLIDEKEEAVTERDAYKCKAHRLNHELLAALKVNEAHPRILDVDGLVLENKYLQERLNSVESELDFTTKLSEKYKSLLDSKKRKGIMKLGGSAPSTVHDTMFSQKQIKTLLETAGTLPTKMETNEDLRGLCLALLDSLNDKNLALNHQKKTNKILATKLADLDQRLKILCGNESDSSVFSPSEILLHGYCSSGVDLSVDGKSGDDSGTISSADIDESTKTSRPPSEDYENDIDSFQTVDYVSGIYYDPIGKDPKVISEAIAKERSEDFKDLPPELAAMVQKALSDLDMKDSLRYSIVISLPIPIQETTMAKLLYSLLIVGAVIAASSAEAPLKSRSSFRRFQRQEVEPTPAAEESVTEAAAPYPPKEDAPYPPAGITPETPFELPTETTIAPEPAQEYGPPAQEYGPPSQEYGPPAASEEGSGQEPPVVEEAVILEEPQSKESLYTEFQLPVKDDSLPDLLKLFN
uniref:DUF4794 domain-containing protein n=1 Tax=Megaselia scalaris TaxID=36166 RepID=T1GDB3_MEGSC